MHRIARAAALLPCLSLTGCLGFVVPVPVSKETVSAKGKISDFDLKNVQPGITRDQVDKQLADIRIDCGTPRVFWGRWKSSRWALAYGVIAPELKNSAGEPAGTGGASRIGKPRNIVLEFDPSGKLLRRHDVNEEGLLPALASSFRNASFPPLTFENAVVMNARHWNHIDDSTAVGKLTLTGAEFRFEEPYKEHNFSVPASAILSLSSGLKYETQAELIAVTVHLSTKSAAGKEVKLGVNPAGLLTLIRWFQQVKAGDLSSTLDPT